MRQQKKLSVLEKIGFGLGEVPGAANSVLAAFLTLFYTDSIGMAAGAVGTMFLISKVFDGISDLVAGSIIDKTKSKWGKARPWLLWLSIPIGLSVALIFWVPKDASPTSQMIFAFVTYNLFSTILYTMVGVAKYSLMPLMTQDTKDRASLAVWSLLLGLGSSIVGAAVTLPLVYALGGDIRAWRLVFIIFGVITSVASLLSFALTRENVAAVEDVTNEEGREKIKFVDGMKMFVKNKYFLFSAFAMFMIQLNIQIANGSQAYFFTYVMGDGMLAASVNMVTLIPTILSLALIGGFVIGKFGKKKSVYIGATAQIIGTVMKGLAAIFVNVPLLIIGTLISSLATAPISIPINTLYADAVDYGEYLTNKRIEGLGSSVGSFANKVSSGLGAAAVGWILQLTGYVANEVQTAATKTAITCLYVWIPVVLIVIIMLGFKFVYHYDEEEPEVLAELERRKTEKAAK